MLFISLMGVVVAGGYGIVHDQLTFTISPEYFTRLKFKQFDFVDFNFGDRVFAGLVGFLGTWWVGLIFAWFIARRSVGASLSSSLTRRIATAFLIMIGCVCIAEFCTLLYYFTLVGEEFSDWALVFRELEITQPWRFVTVASMHNAGYAGAVVGFVWAMFFLGGSSKQS